MPVLPVIQEGQRLNPSSPVPLASTDNARAPGETLAGFGKALFSLGTALDNADKVTARETRDAQIKIALNEARIFATKEQSVQSGIAPIPGDTDGKQALDGYNERLNTKISSLADSFNDDHTKLLFQAAAADLSADSSTIVMANEVAKRANNAKLLEQQLMAQRGEMAKVMPDQIDEILKEGELDILNNKDITDAQKPIAIQEYRKNTVADLIQGHVDRQEWDAAKGAFASFGEFFNAEEKKKTMDDIDSSRWHADQAKLAQIQREEKEQEKAQQIRSDTLYTQTYNQLNLAGNDVRARRTIMDNAKKLGLKPDLIRKLTEEDVFYKELDETASFRIMSELIKTKDTVKANQVIEQLRATKAGISNKTASELLQKVASFKDKEKSDPLFSKLVSQGESIIDTMTDKSISAITDRIEQRQARLKVERVKAKYLTLVYDKDVKNPVNVANNLLKEYFNQSNIVLKGSSEAMGINTAEGLNAHKEKLINDERLRAKSGLSTLRSMNVLKKNLLDIDRAILDLQTMNPSENEAFTKTHPVQKPAPKKGKK